MTSNMTSKKRAPTGVVDLLRLFVVLFCAAIGYQVAQHLQSDASSVLGPFNGAAIGIIVGSGVGYVIGGVLGRTAISVVGRTELSLREVSAEQLVAGVFGAAVGALVGAALTWWVFLVVPTVFAFPVFGFVVAVLALLGYRMGAARREEMLRIFGSHAGMAPRPVEVSSLPRIVDTSIAIDGRILDVARAGFLFGKFLIPSPVLGELQALADAGDDLRRTKGRRGLAALEALKREPGCVVEVLDDDVPAVPEVDAKLIRICLDRQLPLLTLDTNLAKVAALAGVHVMNVHALALALRPQVSAGDDIAVHLLRAGKEPGQAVGYLDDGTMVVAERSRERVGEEVSVRVTSVLTTANGRMVFGQPVDDEPRAPRARPAPPRHDGASRVGHTP